MRARCCRQCTDWWYDGPLALPWDGADTLARGAPPPVRPGGGDRSRDHLRAQAAMARHLQKGAPMVKGRIALSSSRLSALLPLTRPEEDEDYGEERDVGRRGKGRGRGGDSQKRGGEGAGKGKGGGEGKGREGEGRGGEGKGGNGRGGKGRGGEERGDHGSPPPPRLPRPP